MPFAFLLLDKPVSSLSSAGFLDAFNIIYP